MTFKKFKEFVGFKRNNGRDRNTKDEGELRIWELIKAERNKSDEFRIKKKKSQNGSYLEQKLHFLKT